MPNRPTARFGRSVEPWIWAALVAVAFVAAFAVRGAIADDAFIYLRFAENLARGDGWSFNAGETISGTTSPLYTLLLGLAVAIRVPGPDALVLLFGAGLALTAGALHAALRADGRLLALATALVAITWPPLLRAVGLETSLLLATVALAAVAAERGRWRWAGGFAGACALARPEGIALVAVLALVAGSDRRESHSPAGPRYRALAGSFLAVVVPWMIAAGFLFGSLVPHSARVKAIQGSIEWWTQEGDWLATFLRQVPGTPWIFLLVALGARRAVRHARAGRTFALIVVLFGLSQVLGYAILHAPPGYLWYYAPGNLALVVLAACGLREVELLARRLPWVRLRVESPRTPARRPRRLVQNLLLLGLLALYLPLAAGAFRVTASRPFRLAPEYRRAAAWLETHGSPGDWVAANETGYIGYYSGLRVRDMLGLLHVESPEPLRRREWDWWFTTFPAPRFVVVHQGGWIGEPMRARFPWPESSLSRFGSSYEPRHVEGMVQIFELRR